MRWVYSIAILLAGLFLLMLALGNEIQLGQTRELMVKGSPAEGVVTEQLGARKSNAKYYSYRFRAGDRDWTASRRSIPYAAREIPVGSKVAVRYDPSNPERSVTPAELEDLEGWGRFVFLGGGLALVAWAIARMVRRPRAKATP